VPRLARPARVRTIALVVALHASLVIAMWRYAPVRPASQHLPVIAQIVTPPWPALPPPPEARRIPPKAKARRHAPEAPRLRPIEPASVIAVAPMLPAPVVDVPAPAIALPAAPPGPVATAPAAVAIPDPQPTITPPRFDADYLRNPPPEYPAFARRRGEEGRVLLRVHVGADGNAHAVQIGTSSGSERLDHAAAETVKRWKFLPARLGDSAVDAWVVVPIVFSLRS
jgi:periplasmic protein TonB